MVEVGKLAVLAVDSSKERTPTIITKPELTSTTQYTSCGVAWDGKAV